MLYKPYLSPSRQRSPHFPLTLLAAPVPCSRPAFAGGVAVAPARRAQFGSVGKRPFQSRVEEQQLRQQIRPVAGCSTGSTPMGLALDELLERLLKNPNFLNFTKIPTEWLRMTTWPVRIANRGERSCCRCCGERSRGSSAMEWWQRSARCNVANLDADDVLHVVDLVRRAADDEHLLVLVGLWVTAELNMGAGFGGNL